ncbi:MAG: hypothetical protein ACLUJR_05660 [Mediterraneibacter gnavus]
MAEQQRIRPVGNDDYGQTMLHAIAGKGVDISHLRVAEGKTAVSRSKLKMVSAFLEITMKVFWQIMF